MTARRTAAVLFDLDGTLVDSAPDLAGASNDLRAARGLPPLPFERFRPLVGAGARGMLEVALSIGPEHLEFDAYRNEFFRLYEARLTRESRVFDAIPALLDGLKAQGVPWGIVTNKSERFSRPLVEALGLARDAAAVISGDTTPHAKPHPAPLQEAARRMSVEPGDCIYVGDDLRDVQAGQAAGMRTVAVRWGYLGEGEPIEAWGADHVIESPEKLLNLLHMA